LSHSKPIDDKIPLDSIDQRILQHLSTNARVSFQDIAGELGVSRATIHERVKRMTQSGIIRSYRAVIDWTRLGYPVEALVALQTEQGQASYHVLEDLAQIEEVEHAYLITGRFDCLVKIRAHNHEHLQQILFDRVGKVRGFRHAETMVVLSTPLENNFLSHFLDRMEQD
jgi:DNA-binding Lrp family transcriptional regulator